MPDMGRRKPGRPGLTDEQADHVRELLRRVTQEGYAGNASEFARALGLSHSAISQILSRKNRPSYDTVMIVAQHLRCEPADVLSGVAPVAPASGRTDIYPERPRALRRLAGLLPPEVEERVRRVILPEGDTATEDDWILMALARKNEHERELRISRLART